MNQVAFLFHLFYWEESRKKIKLSDGISLNRCEGSRVFKCYEQLCENNGIHNSEPLQLDAYLLIDIKDPDAPYFYSTVKYPDVSVARFCTLFAILSQGPPDLIFSIFSVNRFKDAWSFKTYYDDMGIFDHFEHGIKKFNFDKMKLLWLEIENVYTNKSKNNRIKQALNSFFYSWNNFSLEQMCLNLSIVLETLFSPTSNNELSHRIGYNYCYFISEDKTNREKNYKFFKNFYTIRSKIVHGSTVEYDTLCDVVPKMYISICKLLEKILTHKDLQAIFNDDGVRNKTFNDWLFD